MTKRFFVIHCWEGHPNNNWYPWLKEELERSGVQVDVPAMPSPGFPVMAEWMERLRQTINNPDETVCLVGHSLGVIAILPYLESLPGDKKIGAAVLVAGFAEPIGY